MNRTVAAGSVAAGVVAGAAAGALAIRRQREQLVAALVSPGQVREVDGERIHYIDEGSGPAIVLIHGFGGSTFSWRHVVTPLAATHRVVALDLPGFGFSERRPIWPLTLEQHARRVARLMEELGIERASVVGHSMGGGVAARLAATFPAMVERLVLLASIDPGEQRWLRGSRALGPVLLAARLGLEVPAITRAACRPGLRSLVWDPSFMTEEVIRGYCDPLMLPGTGACLRKLGGDMRLEPPVDVSSIAALTLVISGEADRGIPPGVGERIAAAIPGSRHVVVPETGHLVAEEQPSAFLAHLREFLSEAEAPPSRRSRKKATAATGQG